MADLAWFYVIAKYFIRTYTYTYTSTSLAEKKLIIILHKKLSKLL